MKRREALDFLRSHQPMPAEAELTDELMETFDKVRRFFLAEPDPDCIPLFLNAFGAGMGYGVYQLVEDVLAKFPQEQVVPHLIESLRSPHWGVRFWSAQLCKHFPDPALVPGLREALRIGSADIRWFAASALAAIDSPSSVEAMREALAIEREADILEVLTEGLRGGRPDRAV